MRIGKCKKCKIEFKSNDKFVDVYDDCFNHWYKLCPKCYEEDLDSGKIKLCKIVDGYFEEIK